MPSLSRNRWGNHGLKQKMMLRKSEKNLLMLNLLVLFVLMQIASSNEEVNIKSWTSGTMKMLTFLSM